MSDKSPVDIRIVAPEDFVHLRVGAYAFGASPSKPDPEAATARLKYFEHSTGFGAFDGSTALATASVLTMTENIRGKLMPMGGIGGVASLPEGRRQGHVRSLLTYTFEVMHERDIAVSTLYPFRDSFYERLGYAQFPQTRFAIIKPQNLAPLLRESLPGETTQVDIATGFDDWWGFQERLIAERHGFSLVNISRAQQLKDDNGSWVALVREDGVITGSMTFKITGYTKDLIADSFHYTTAAARYQLLAWVARHVDQVKQAVIELGPDEHPETWYRDIYAESSTENEHAWPSPMGRVISVAGLDGIAAGADAAISFRLVDDFCPWNNDVWTLTGDGGRLQVQPGGDPVCHLTIQGLSALVWTGEDPATFGIRHWGDPDAAAQDTLSALFPPLKPELNEKF